MSLLDDLATRVNQAQQNIAKNITDINSYINANVTEPLVKVGAAAKGNLSEAEIKAGKKGAPPPVATAVSAPAIQAGIGIGTIAVIGAIAYFVFFSKKSRG